MSLYDYEDRQRLEVVSSREVLFDLLKQLESLQGGSPLTLTVGTKSAVIKGRRSTDLVMGKVIGVVKEELRASI